MLNDEDWLLFINHPLLGRVYPLPNTKNPPKSVVRKKKGIRYKRCMMCAGCLRVDDCMDCVNCDSKHHGVGKRKQLCKAKRCGRLVRLS